MLDNYSFPPRTINVWNKLSTHCVHAGNFSMFKNRIDKYLEGQFTLKIREGYT